MKYYYNNVVLLFLCFLVITVELIILTAQIRLATFRKSHDWENLVVIVSRKVKVGDNQMTECHKYIPNSKMTFKSSFYTPVLWEMVNKAMSSSRIH